MTRIECTCKVCQANAAKIGKASLAALVPDSALATANAPGGIHGVVYSANDPTFVGQRVRDLTGIQAG